MARRFRKTRFLSAAAVGAAAMYYLDRQQGHARRARTRDQVRAAVHRAERDAERERRYAAGVAEGQKHQGGPAHRPADDRALVDRVRSMLGPAFPHDRVSIDAVDGTVELRGQLDDRRQITELVDRVRAVPGVKSVNDLLHLPGEPAPNLVAAEEASRRAPPTS